MKMIIKIIYFWKLLNFFVLSPIEKTYITKIENEINESERLDSDITKVES